MNPIQCTVQSNREGQTDSKAMLQTHWKQKRTPIAGISFHGTDYAWLENPFCVYVPMYIS